MASKISLFNGRSVITRRNRGSSLVLAVQGVPIKFLAALIAKHEIGHKRQNFWKNVRSLYSYRDNKSFETELKGYYPVLGGQMYGDHASFRFVLCIMVPSLVSTTYS